MPSDILKQITEFWNKLGKKTKTVILISLGSVVFVSIVITILLNIKSYDVLYSGLSSQEQAQIVSKLGEMGIDFKTQPGGIILVPGDKVAGLKMQLSSEGYPKSTLTYDLFTSSSSFMTTDFEKRQYLIFQLQERLQEAIKTISGVRDAIVTLSITEESAYVLETEVVPSTASLVLDLESSVSLTPKQIKGIENLIAKSVPGLTNDNVSIIDSEGNILNSGSSSGQGVNLEKVEIEKQAGEIYKEKIIRLLEPIYGEKGVSVAVNVSIDFTQKTTDQIEYTPVDTGGIQEGEDPERVLNQIQSQIVNSGGEVSDITASIIINKRISDQERADVNSIVANSLGVEQENVIVTSMVFEAANERQKKALEALKHNPSFFAQNAKFIIPFAAAAAASVITLLVVMMLKKRKPGLAPAFEYGEAKGANNLNLTEEVPAIVLNETREQGLKRQIREFSSSNPQIVAQLIRTWLKEDDE